MLMEVPFNNLSVIPFYDNVNEQNARKWWVYGRVYPLFTPADKLLPFQIIMEGNNASSVNISHVDLYDKNGTLVYNLDGMLPFLYKVQKSGFWVIVFQGTYTIPYYLEQGQYYLRILVGSAYKYSEVFTVVKDIQPYLKIQWWDIEDFVMDAGIIIYDAESTTAETVKFKNTLYLDADVAKPDYLFEDENENRDGYAFPVKQISEKKYRFSYFASEYLLDVMRLIRMADYVEITYNGKLFKPDSFLITPEWVDEGDVATVQAEFETATVAKKLGRGYSTVPATGHSFDHSFDESFDIE